MGLILDSSVLVAAERQGQNSRQILSEIVRKIGDTEVAISVISCPRRGTRRQDRPKGKAPTVHSRIADCGSGPPVTVSIALRAGQIDGENQSKGLRIPLSDLLIGVTALEFGYDVATSNVRHFRLIPEITVLEL